MTFPCTSCGECCRRAGSVPGFPEPVLPNGTCSRLSEDGRCSIYETRPAICRISEMATAPMIAAVSRDGSIVQIKNPHRSRAAYYMAAAEACNRFQEEAGTDAAFRVKL